jgi:hypothetical protein
MCRARRVRYVELLNQGMNFTQAARTVGASKRTGRTWRNGRTRSTGRDERPLVDWYRHGMGQPKPIGTRHPSRSERIGIAGRLRDGGSMRAMALLLQRSASSIGREIRRDGNPRTGRYEPCLAHQLGHERLKRPESCRIMARPSLFAHIRDGLRRRLSPERISGRLGKPSTT